MSRYGNRFDDDEPDYKFDARTGDACLGPYSDSCDWLVKPLIPAGTTVLFGPRSSGKTFLALSLAGAAAEGKPWLGQFAVNSSEFVVYVMSEGSAAKRVNALSRTHSKDTLKDVTFIERPVDFTDAREVDAFVRFLADRKSAPSFLIIDTYGACIGTEGSENDDVPVRKLFRGIEQVREKFGGSVGRSDRLAVDVRSRGDTLHRASAALSRGTAEGGAGRQGKARRCACERGSGS